MSEFKVLLNDVLNKHRFYVLSVEWKRYDEAIQKALADFQEASKKLADYVENLEKEARRATEFQL